MKLIPLLIALTAAKKGDLKPDSNGIVTLPANGDFEVVSFRVGKIKMRFESFCTNDQHHCACSMREIVGQTEADKDAHICQAPSEDAHLPTLHELDSKKSLCYVYIDMHSDNAVQSQQTGRTQSHDSTEPLLDNESDQTRTSDDGPAQIFGQTASNLCKVIHRPHPPPQNSFVAFFTGSSITPNGKTVYKVPISSSLHLFDHQVRVKVGEVNLPVSCTQVKAGLFNKGNLCRCIIKRTILKQGPLTCNPTDDIMEKPAHMMDGTHCHLALHYDLPIWLVTDPDKSIEDQAKNICHTVVPNSNLQGIWKQIEPIEIPNVDSADNFEELKTSRKIFKLAQEQQALAAAKEADRLKQYEYVLPIKTGQRKRTILDSLSDFQQNRQIRL